MRVKIHPEAVAYRKAQVASGHPQPNQHWLDCLAVIQGQWVEVETRHLFDDQFNLVPTKGSPNGLRVMARDVCEVQGEFRSKVTKCRWCGTCHLSVVRVCSKCGNLDWLELLKPAPVRSLKPEPLKGLKESRKVDGGVVHIDGSKVWADWDDTGYGAHSEHWSLEDTEWGRNQAEINFKDMVDRWRIC